MNGVSINSDWLSQLAAEHAPLVPGWWPPAPGWWIVSVVLLAAVAGAVVWWRRPRRRVRRVALRELRRIRGTDTDPIHAARSVQNLLRRYALVAFGADRVARLTGQAWLHFVAARGAESLGGPLGQSLLATSFGGRIADHQQQDRDAWCAAAEQFLRRAVQYDRRGGHA
jgi:hypothetical protein